MLAISEQVGGAQRPLRMAVKDNFFGIWLSIHTERVSTLGYLRQSNIKPSYASSTKQCLALLLRVRVSFGGKLTSQHFI